MAAFLFGCRKASISAFHKIEADPENLPTCRFNLDFVGHAQMKEVFFKTFTIFDMISLQHHVEDDRFFLKTPRLCA